MLLFGSNLAPSFPMGIYTDSGRKKLGLLINSARKRSDGSTVSLRELADRIGCAHTTIMRMESGSIDEPPIDVLNNLAPLLGLSLPEVIEILADTPLSQSSPRFAEDVIPHLEDLPGLEMQRLIDILHKRLRARRLMDDQL